MQSTPPIEPFKSMMFKKRAGPRETLSYTNPYGSPDYDENKPTLMVYDDVDATRVPIGEWYEDDQARQLLQHSNATSQNVVEGQKKGNGRGMLYQQIMQPDAQRARSGPKRNVASTNVIDDPVKRAEAREKQKLINKEKRRFKIPHALSQNVEIFGDDGSIVTGEDKIIGMISAKVGEIMADVYARSGGKKIASLPEVLDYIYAGNKDLSFKTNEGTTGDVNFGRAVFNEFRRQLRNASRADERERKRIEDNGGIWDEDSSKLRNHPYYDTYIQEICEDNKGAILRLALRVAQNNLRNMMQQGNGINRNFSNEEINNFVAGTIQATKDAEAEIGDDYDELYAYDGGIDAEMPVEDEAGKLNAVNQTVANVHAVYPPYRFGGYKPQENQKEIAAHVLGEMKQHRKEIEFLDDFTEIVAKRLVNENDDGTKYDQIVEDTISQLTPEGKDYLAKLTKGDPNILRNEIVYGPRGLGSMGLEPKDIVKYASINTLHQSSARYDKDGNLVTPASSRYEVDEKGLGYSPTAAHSMVNRDFSIRDTLSKYLNDHRDEGVTLRGNWDRIEQQIIDEIVHGENGLMGVYGTPEHIGEIDKLIAPYHYDPRGMRYTPNDKKQMAEIGNYIADVIVNDLGQADHAHGFDVDVAIEDFLDNHPEFFVKGGVENVRNEVLSYARDALIHRGYSADDVIKAMKLIDSYRASLPQMSEKERAAYKQRITDLDNLPMREWYHDKRPIPVKDTSGQETYQGLVDESRALNRAIKEKRNALKNTNDKKLRAQLAVELQQLNVRKQKLDDRFATVKEKDKVAKPVNTVGQDLDALSVGGIPDIAEYRVVRNEKDPKITTNVPEIMTRRPEVMDRMRQGIANIIAVSDGHLGGHDELTQRFKDKLATLEDQDLANELIATLDGTPGSFVDVMERLSSEEPHAYRAGDKIKEDIVPALHNVLLGFENGVKKQLPNANLGETDNVRVLEAPERAKTLARPGGKREATGLTTVRDKNGIEHVVIKPRAVGLTGKEYAGTTEPIYYQTTTDRGGNDRKALLDEQRKLLSAQKQVMDEIKNLGTDGDQARKERLGVQQHEINSRLQEIAGILQESTSNIGIGGQFGNTVDPGGQMARQQGLKGKEVEAASQDYEKQLADKTPPMPESTKHQTSDGTYTTDEEEEWKNKVAEWEAARNGTKEDTEEVVTADSASVDGNIINSEDGEIPMTDEEPVVVEPSVDVKTTSSKKSALDIPFSAMLKSANEKAGQERGLPSGAVMKETLPAYYRTVKMVGDHPDAIGFSVYEHKKMNAEDGEEHKTDLPKPIKKGTVEYVEKSSIRDLIEGDHIAKMIIEPGANYARYAHYPEYKTSLARFNMGRYADEQEAKNAAAMQEFRNGRMESVATPPGMQTTPDVDLTNYFYRVNSTPLEEVVEEETATSSRPPRPTQEKPKAGAEDTEDYGTRDPIISEDEVEDDTPVEGATPEDTFQDRALHEESKRTTDRKGDKNERGGGDTFTMHLPVRSGKEAGKHPAQKPKYKTEKKHTGVAASSEATPMEKSIPSFREMMGQHIAKTMWNPAKRSITNAKASGDPKFLGEKVKNAIALNNLDNSITNLDKMIDIELNRHDFVPTPNVNVPRSDDLRYGDSGGGEPVEFLERAIDAKDAAAKEAVAVPSDSVEGEITVPNDTRSEA